MILVLLAGGACGAAILLLVSLLQSRAPQGAAGLAAIDAERQRGQRVARLTADRRHAGESIRARRVGSAVRDLLDKRGLHLPPSARANLAMVGTSVEAFIAQSLLAALVGFIAPLIALSPFLLGGSLGVTTPLWLCILGGALGLVLPYSQLGGKAEEKRRDFRHAVGSFLDLVAMNLSGGRGVPEALTSASRISDGWAMTRIRDTLEAARLQGVTPWAALGELGDDLDLDELRDLSSTLTLVAEDGAKVRESLAARATSMRRKELADAEGRAGARSQSMLIAQLLLCIGFLLFLGYPAIARILA